MAAKSNKGAGKVGLGLLLSDEKDDETSTHKPSRRFHPLPPKAANKESCVVCFRNVDSDLMFVVDGCGHRFCFDCVKKHIKVKLLDGSIPNCLQHRCKSQLSINTCDKLLSPKLSLMWRERIKENSSPLSERVYCPYPSCGYLMSKAELYQFSEYGRRRCLKCNRSFCLHCKVPWHSSQSCTEYKKLDSSDSDAELNSLANRKGWRRCGKCQHMIERSSGCDRMSCRCGNVFCYKCGSELKEGFNCKVCNVVPEAIIRVPREIFTAPKAVTSVPKMSPTVPETSTGVPQAVPTVPEVFDAVLEDNAILPKTFDAVVKVPVDVPEVSNAVPEDNASVPHASDAVPKAVASVKRDEFDYVPKAVANSVKREFDYVPKAVANSVKREFDYVPKAVASVKREFDYAPREFHGIVTEDDVVAEAFAGVKREFDYVPREFHGIVTEDDDVGVIHGFETISAGVAVVPHAFATVLDSERIETGRAQVQQPSGDHFDFSSFLFSFL